MLESITRLVRGAGKSKGKKARFGTLSGSGSGSYNPNLGILIASSNPALMQFGKAQTIRGILEDKGIIEKVININGSQAIQITATMPQGVSVPDDFSDWKNYLDVYFYNPMVGSATDLKQSLIWQMGYTLEGDETNVKKVMDYLASIDADKSLRDDSFWSLMFGNMYWSVKDLKKGDAPIALNPMAMGAKADANGNLLEYVYCPRYGAEIRYKPEEILHLRYNAKPWDLFGIAPFKKFYATAKIVMDMETDLPTIVKRRADPPVSIQIGEPSGQNMVGDDEYKRVEGELRNRKAGDDIYHDGILKFSEVYQSRGTAQTVEPLIDHFIANLVAGLSVPEIALGHGGTTTMATAEYQERILESEIRAYQRALKRFHEQLIFPLAGVPAYSVKLNWNALSPEDKAEVSKQLMEEIEHGVISPEYARTRLGYPEESGAGTVMSMSLKPVGVEPVPTPESELPKLQAEFLRKKLKKG